MRWNDPLAELVDALRYDGKPELSWVMTWAPDGDLRSAWARARRPFDLLCVLGLVDKLPRSNVPTGWWLVTAGIAILEIDLPDGSRFQVIEGEVNPACAEAVRRWFPEPPTLNELLEVARAPRASRPPSLQDATWQARA